MRVILTVGFVSLIACSLAMPVPAPNQNASNIKVRVFRSINKDYIFRFYLQKQSVVTMSSGGAQ
jgi:hypothetical protein